MNHLHKNQRPPNLNDPPHQHRSGVARTYWLMQRAGHPLCLHPGELALALKASEPPESRAQLLLAAHPGVGATGPAQLEQLPLAWLQAWPALWGELQAIYPRCRGVAGWTVAEDQGVFRLAGAQEVELPLEPPSLFDRLRVAINARLYPSLWQPWPRPGRLTGCAFKNSELNVAR